MDTSETCAGCVVGESDGEESTVFSATTLYFSSVVRSSFDAFWCLTLDFLDFLERIGSCSMTSGVGKTGEGRVTGDDAVGLGCFGCFVDCCFATGLFCAFVSAALLLACESSSTGFSAAADAGVVGWVEFIGKVEGVIDMLLARFATLEVACFFGAVG
jgi:hypothetical protein